MEPLLHTDHELFHLVSSGDEQAFTCLFNRYSDQLFSYSIKILHSRFWAEEAVQNTFFQVWKNRNSLGAVGEPHAYLFKVTANRCIDILRRNEKHFRISQRMVGTAPLGESAEEVFDFRNSELIVQKAISALPEKRRLIYLLKNNEGMSYEQIADQLHLSSNTVRNQLSKAAENIRAYLLSNGICLALLITFCITR